MTQKLDARIMDPPAVADGAPVLILMHGRGADPADLASLRPWIADGTSLVLPRAPFPASAWGYGPGWAWYRYDGEDRPAQDSFRASLSLLDDLLDNLPRRLGYQPGPVLVGGFSQGGTLALGYALANPGKVRAVLNFSGFLPDHPDVPVTPDAVRGTRFFWGHGTGDPNIPFQLAQRGRRALTDAGADLDARDYDMGHAISAEELKDAVGWMATI
jgi:phospholipase/carboxylesterase